MSANVVILGRPNVGKSTLFNRLVGRKLAIVHDEPGVTRDRREAPAELADLRFTLMDTAGLEEGDEKSLWGRMRAQTEKALEGADVILMMIDARAGITPLDAHFAGWVRRLDRPTILIANKCEGAKAHEGLYEAHTLGLGEPVALSAEHGEGLAELYEALAAAFEKAGIEAREIPGDDLQEDPFVMPEEGDMGFEFEGEMEWDESKPLQIAIVGRPNAGKSTLINHLVGEERVITGPEAGLTRDSIAVPALWDGRPVKLYDTAGLRRKAKITEKLEKLSVADALRAVRFAHAVVVLLDAELGLEKQDIRIAELAADEGRAVIIVLNKWDKLSEEQRKEVWEETLYTLDRSLPQISGVTLIPVSAETGENTADLMPAILDAVAVWAARIPTGKFNTWLRAAVDRHTPPLAPNGRRIKIRYGAQVKTRPPTFVLFMNRPKDLPASYLRYLERDLRRTFDLPGTPVRLLRRKGKNPYN